MMEANTTIHALFSSPILLSTLALSLILLLSFFLQFPIHRHGRPLRRPPGTLPLAGYGLWFLRPRHTLLTWFASISASMGHETFELPVPSLPPAVLVNSPAVLERILRDDGSTFVKGTFFRSRSQDLFRDGILNADGALWRVQRKAGLRFLGRSNLRRFVDGTLIDLVAGLVRRLYRAADEGRVVDLQAELLELTTRFMGRVAYGMDFGGDLPVAKAFDYASAMTGARFTNPLWRAKEYFFGSKLRRAIEEVHRFGEKLVHAAMQARREKTAQGRQDDSGDKDEDKGPLQTNLINSLLDHIPDTAVVAAAAMNFLSAGRDTTAQSMSWTMYCLLRNPQKLLRLRSTLLTNATTSLNSSHPQILSYDAVTNPSTHPYLSAVFAEALRLYPPIPFELKETTQPVVLPDGTALPAGAVVIWIPFAMARNPQIWGVDAARFRPERWIDDGGKDVSYRFQGGEGWRHGSWIVDLSGAEFLPNLKTPYENPVFMAGPRACIGKQMAEAMAAVVVAALVTGFEFEEVRGRGEVDGERVGGDALTMPILGGLPVRVRSRI